MNADFYIARAIPGMEQSWDERLGAIIFSLAGKWFWRRVMTTFVMPGRMSGESMKEIRPQRTMEALALIKKYGGELKSGYVMLGKYDLILILELPNKEQAIKTAVGLSRLLGVTFITSPAITFEEFDQLMMED